MDRKHRYILLPLIPGVVVTILLLYLYAATPARVFGAPQTAEYPQNSEKASNRVFLPLINNECMDLKVNPHDKHASASFYNNVYLAAEEYSTNWTGNYSACNEGKTSEEIQHAVRLRINYFRAMAGVPSNVAFADEYNRKAQKAAMMMSVNGQISHNPPESWECYSAEGEEAAHNSNLYYGRFGSDAVTGYIRDNGAGNYAVGHRRWVLFPQTQYMGTGNTPTRPGYQLANALWVFDDNVFGPSPKTRDGFVAWPPPGYVPYQVVFPRWSFSYTKADFSNAQVSMSRNGSNLKLFTLELVIGYGDNTIVWEPILNLERPPKSDATYSVKIKNVIIDGSAREFSYNVVIFDPGTQTSIHPEESLEVGLDQPPMVP